ncbi:Uncharacterized membrane protein YidH, DUF202 family [Actinopolyspora saharensis]|uniref:Uncharacterized membrane protein YidH, DUF202 family n=2 Tax=Actinopolyspora saharensis TaxID=995062 RepID=A0A1H0ZEX7_9ACTN|nr:Uncharacterized membrane protein YidH, DUF202 family [Actinopolyspora saharensis]
MGHPGQPPEPPPGLQTERTTLAWLRTALTFLVGALVLLKLVAHTRPRLAVGAACVLLPVAGLVSALAVHRHHAENRDHEPRPLRDGTLPAGITLLATLVAGLGTLYVLTG